MTPRNLTTDSESLSVNLASCDLDAMQVTRSERLDWLLACAKAGTLTGTPYKARLVDGGFGATPVDAKQATAVWLCRALMVYRSVRGLASAGQRSVIEAWLIEQAQYMATMLQTQLGSVFPARASDDYSVRLGDAASASLTSRRLVWGGQYIPTLALYYNNRRADMALFVGLCGIELGADALVEAAKRYIREWLMFGVFDGGAQGELQRDGDYGVAHQGMIYGAVNVAVALELASRLHQMGDDSLVQFETTVGTGGTESKTPKSIKATLDWHMGIIRGGHYINAAGACVRGPLISSYGRSIHHAAFIRPVARLGWDSRWIADDVAQDVPGVQNVTTAYGKLSGIAGIYL